MQKCYHCGVSYNNRTIFDLKNIILNTFMTKIPSVNGYNYFIEVINPKILINKPHWCLNIEQNFCKD